jgi:hypothetical protein
MVYLSSIHYFPTHGDKGTTIYQTYTRAGNFSIFPGGYTYLRLILVPLSPWVGMCTNLHRFLRGQSWGQGSASLSLVPRWLGYLLTLVRLRDVRKTRGTDPARVSPR